MHRRPQVLDEAAAGASATRWSSRGRSRSRDTGVAGSFDVECTLELARKREANEQADADVDAEQLAARRGVLSEKKAKALVSFALKAKQDADAASTAVERKALRSTRSSTQRNERKPRTGDSTQGSKAIGTAAADLSSRALQEEAQSMLLRHSARPVEVAGEAYEQGMAELNSAIDHRWITLFHMFVCVTLQEIAKQLIRRWMGRLHELTSGERTKQADTLPLAPCPLT